MELDAIEQRVVVDRAGVGGTAPEGLEAENYEAASERIFPFLVRDFTRDVVADLRRDDVVAAIAAIPR